MKKIIKLTAKNLDDLIESKLDLLAEIRIRHFAAKILGLKTHERLLLDMLTKLETEIQEEVTDN